MATWRKTLSSNQYYEVILNVDQTSQNIANNTSNISWSLQVRKTYGSGFWGADGTASTWTVTIDGVNVSSSSSSYDFRGGAPLTKTIASGTRTITHNGDGSRSFGASGYWRDNVNGLGNATATGTFTLSTIPRASELTAFSFASHLKNDVANTINYTVSKKSTNFRHQIQLRDGSTTVFQWDNSNSNGVSTIALSASDVNTLLSRMPTSTTKTFTLRIATRSGVNGGFVGSVVTRTATGTVHDDVKPNVWGESFGISQNGIDKQIGKYVQGFTRVDASYNANAGYGSSIQSNSMTVQTTHGSDSQVINGNVGTTANPVSHSGTYRVICTTVDERGRKTITSSAHFTVEAYSAPVITDFNLSRHESTPTTVYVGVAGIFSSIGTSNLATLIIERKNGNTWETIGTNNTSNTGGISREVNVPNNSITSSYEFKARVTDLFGGVSEVIDTVSTQRVVMDIYRNSGVAFGKMYDTSLGGDVQIDGNVTGGLSVIGTTSLKGALEVDGDSSMEGGLTVLGGGMEIGRQDVRFTPYIDFHSSGESHDYDVRLMAAGGYGNGRGGSALLQIVSNDVAMTGNLTTRNGVVTVGQGITSSGNNENGRFIKFNDGTLICWHEVRTISGASHATGPIFRTDSTIWTFPASFVGTPMVQGTPIAVATETWAGMGTSGPGATNASFMVWSTWNRGTTGIIVGLVAIGRWG